MPEFEIYRDPEPAPKKWNASGPTKSTNKKSNISDVERARQEEAIREPQPDYVPRIHPTYEPYQLIESAHRSLSPIELFLLIFAPILHLLILHTNAKATRAIPGFKPITILEMRCWIAVRLDMTTEISEKTDIQKYWDKKVKPRRWLSKHRFYNIERFLSVNSAKRPPSSNAPWFWLVLEAVDCLRAQLRKLFIPSSHIAVDESTIEFHGKLKYIFLLKHKPAGSSFLIYALASHGGLVHDILFSSSQDGLESFKEGISINLATRGTRKRKRGTTGANAEEIHLPALKGGVFQLCEHIKRDFPTRAFICFIDNLFTDPNLARALASINVGICGTVRGNAPVIPQILKDIRDADPPSLEDN